MSLRSLKGIVNDITQGHIPGGLGEPPQIGTDEMVDHVNAPWDPDKL